MSHQDTCHLNIRNVFTEMEWLAPGRKSLGTSIRNWLANYQARQNQAILRPGHGRRE